MNRFVYRVYYEYNGKTHSDPFRSKKSDQKVDDALSRFAVELPQYLSDRDASVTGTQSQHDPKSVVVNIVTVLDETSTDEAVKRCLNGLDLFGTKLPEG